MRARFHAHAAARPAGVPLSETLVVLKEPHGSQAVDLIVEALPESRLLFLLRDGRDVIDSELAAPAKGSWLGDVFPVVAGIAPDERLAFVEPSAHKWLWRTEVVEQAYAANQGPKLLVRYEDMLAGASAQLRRVFHWLGLEIADADLESLVQSQSFERLPAEHRGSDKIFRAAQPGLWREKPERRRAGGRRARNGGPNCASWAMSSTIRPTSGLGSRPWKLLLRRSGE